MRDIGGNGVWNKYPQTRPLEPGDYLVLYDDGAGGISVNADVATFYNAGDIIGAGEPESGETAEERLLDSVMCRPIIASKAGFYCTRISDETAAMCCWEVKPAFWTFLPEAPKGYKYND